MKKALLIFFVLFTLSIAVKAQISLEHTFNYNNPSVFQFEHFSQIMYYFAENNTIYFYNENYTLYKSVNINTPSGYTISYVFYPAVSLFNTDDLIEFVCAFTKDDYTGVKSMLYNENGAVLETFENSYPHYIQQTTNNGYRMLMRRYSNYPSDYVMDVYSLPGTLTATQNDKVMNLVPAAYPNPANEKIFLTYDLNKKETTDMFIFDGQGQLIETLKIGGHFNKILLNTSGYLPGNYMYSYNGISNKFVVK